jgi:aminoglycoside phosphotransferase
MSEPGPDRAALLALLPEESVGAVERLEPIALGASGAGVYAVSASRGAFVLRLQGPRVDDGFFAQQLRVLRRAAAASIAPAVVHVDEAARALVLQRAPGVPIAAALAEPVQREALFASLVEQLRTLHALDPADVAERDPLAKARALWEASRVRPGFPVWAGALAPMFDAIAAALAHDPRRGVSHNDLNPTNILWDGGRAWIVDWEVTGLGHPYYDLAVLALFLRLGDDAALDLAARHDGAPLDARSRASFHALRQLAGLLCGLIFLSLVDDLGVWPAPTRADAPSLVSCYRAIHAGTLDVQSPPGRASFGLALLAESIARPAWA